MKPGPLFAIRPATCSRGRFAEAQTQAAPPPPLERFGPFVSRWAHFYVTAHGSYRLLSTTTATAERLPQPDSVPQQQQGTPARTSAPYTTREELPARTDWKRDSRRKRRAGTPGPRSRGDRARRHSNAFGRTCGRGKRETSTAGPPHEAECEAERAGSAGELQAPPSRGCTSPLATQEGGERRARPRATNAPVQRE